MVLDKSTPVPLYYQIKQILLHKIDNQELSPGDKAPSERELSEMFGVSRMTARQALRELEAEGYLNRAQGIGSFISEPKLEQSLLTLISFTEEMEQRGLRPSTKLIHVATEKPTTRVAHLLRLRPEDHVTRIERLRYADNTPMSLELSLIPTYLCPELERENLTGSLYSLLETKYNIKLDEARQTLDAVHAGVHEAASLEVAVGVPLLKLQRVTRDSSGIPAEYVRAFYRGDRYTFMTALKRYKGEIKSVSVDQHLAALEVEAT